MIERIFRKFNWLREAESTLSCYKIMSKVQGIYENATRRIMGLASDGYCPLFGPATRTLILLWKIMNRRLSRIRGHSDILRYNYVKINLPCILQFAKFGRTKQFNTSFNYEFFFSFKSYNIIYSESFWFLMLLKLMRCIFSHSF